MACVSKFKDLLPKFQQAIMDGRITLCHVCEFGQFGIYSAEQLLESTQYQFIRCTATESTVQLRDCSIAEIADGFRAEST